MTWILPIYAIALASLVVGIAAANTANVLIFSATNGYRHASIPVAIEALQSAGPAHNMQFTDTEDPTMFNDDTLSLYDAILFLMVTDTSPAHPIINAEQQQSFQNYLNKGGNFIGVHAASVCLRNTTFYGKELGAYFSSHRTIGNATFLNNIDPTNPIVSMIPPSWTYEEEVYSFESDPRSVGAKVVLTVYGPDGDPDASVEGRPHPIAWYQTRGAGVSPDAQLAGRSFYTALGHLSSTWQDPIFMGHVMAGVTWTMGGNTTRAFNAHAQVGNNRSSTPTISSPGSSTSGSSGLGSSASTSKTSSSAIGGASLETAVVLGTYLVGLSIFVVL